MKRIKVKVDFHSEFVGNVVYSDGREADSLPIQGNENSLKSEIMEIVTYSNGRKFIFKSKIIDIKEERYLSRIPNPVFILLNSSIENYNISKELSSNFIHNSKKIGNDIYRLKLNSDGTSEIFNKYLECKITSVNSLINSLEIFINQKIPHDYVYSQQIDKKVKKFNKAKIENGLSFREKIEKLIPEIFPALMLENVNILEDIFEAYSLRKDIVHMKTQGTTVFDQYYEVMSKLVESDIERFIRSGIVYMNSVDEDEDLIEYEL